MNEIPFGATIMTPAEWMLTEHYLGWRIIDFDGWNLNEYVRKIEWRTPITAEEMESRFSQCTVEQFATNTD